MGRLVKMIRHQQLKRVQGQPSQIMHLPNRRQGLSRRPSLPKKQSRGRCLPREEAPNVRYLHNPSTPHKISLVVMRAAARGKTPVLANMEARNPRRWNRRVGSAACSHVSAMCFRERARTRAPASHLMKARQNRLVGSPQRRAWTGWQAWHFQRGHTHRMGQLAVSHIRIKPKYQIYETVTNIFFFRWAGIKIFIVWAESPVPPCK